jgi:hypothetical protein
MGSPGRNSGIHAEDSFATSAKDISIPGFAQLVRSQGLAFVIDPTGHRDSLPMTEAVESRVREEAESVRKELPEAARTLELEMESRLIDALAEKCTGSCFAGPGQTAGLVYSLVGS